MKGSLTIPVIEADRRSLKPYNL